MKRFPLLALSCAIALFMNDSLASAQRPGVRGGQGAGERGGGQRPGQAGNQRPGQAGNQRPGQAGGQRPGQAGGQRPGQAGGQRPTQRPEQAGRGLGTDSTTMPMFRIIDTNSDGKLSPMEITAARSSLLKLDINGDGKLAADELAPVIGKQQLAAGRGSSGSSGGRGSKGGGRRNSDAAFAGQVMELDENKDGAISKSELPKHMHKAFDDADVNRDGSLNEAERLVLASHFGRKKLSPHGQTQVNAPTQGRRPN